MLKDNDCNAEHIWRDFWMAMLFVFVLFPLVVWAAAAVAAWIVSL